MTEAEVITSYGGKVCPVCGGPKAVRTAFCPTDWAALPMPARWALAKGERSSVFAQIFRSWMRHLQLNGERKQLLRSGPGLLPYRNLEEMLAAGYKFSGYGQCGAIHCLGPTIRMLTPGLRYLTIDERSLQPHVLSCKDPGWRDRRKEFEQQRHRERAQASAKRRRDG